MALKLDGSGNIAHSSLKPRSLCQRLAVIIFIPRTLNILANCLNLILHADIHIYFKQLISWLHCYIEALHAKHNHDFVTAYTNYMITMYLTQKASYDCTKKYGCL